MGTSGGDYRPQQHALLITNLIDYGLDLQSAVEFPRFLWRVGVEILVEEGFRGLDGLEEMATEYPSEDIQVGLGWLTAA